MRQIDQTYANIPLLILKHAAKCFRSSYYQYDIKAHPANDSAILVFKNHKTKIIFNMFAGDINSLSEIMKILSISSVKALVDKFGLHKQSTDNKYIICASIYNNNQPIKSHETGIDLADPDSINKIMTWIRATVSDAEK